MKTSVIRQRVADFFRRFPPFDALSDADLLDLAGSGKVRFHESEEFIVRSGDALGEQLWMIQQGKVEIVDQTNAEGCVQDVLTEGDLLGLERFSGDTRANASARTATDVILYGISAALFEPLIARYPSVRQFLAARFTGAGNLGFDRTSWLDGAAPPPDFIASRLQTLLQERPRADCVAALFGAKNGLVALVDAEGALAGLISERHLALAPENGEDWRVKPAVPYAASPVSVRDAVNHMLGARCEVLALTENGAPGGRLLGLLSASDLAMFCGHNPVRLVEAMRQARSAAELQPLLGLARGMIAGALAQPGDVDECCRLDAAVVAALAEACIRSAEEELLAAGIEKSPLPFCWLLFGSSARGDLFGNELPAIAVVYDDTCREVSTDDRIYFAGVAGGTNDRLHSFGLSETGMFWPDGVQPSMPISEWERLYRETIANPLQHNLYQRRALFDTRFLFGDENIARLLCGHVLEAFGEQSAAIPLFANDTLAQMPPLAFLDGLVLGMDGQTQESFDLVEAITAPVANAARVFSLAAGRLGTAATLERMEAAEGDFPDASPAIRKGADAFRIGLFYQTLRASSQVIPGELGKFDQILLKTAFSAVRDLLESTVAIFVKAPC